MNLALSDDSLKRDINTRKDQDSQEFQKFVSRLPELIKKYLPQYFKEQNEYIDIEEFKKYFISCMQDYINYRKHLKNLKNILNHDLELAQKIEGYQQKRPEIFLEYDKTAIVLSEYLKAKQEKFGYGSGGVIKKSVNALWLVLTRKKGK